MSRIYDTLSEKQRQIADCTERQVIVKACPGSGKTYSVAARLEKLLLDWDKRHQGIATISFTNNACNEIVHYLNQESSNDFISYPHFIGTIDSFINHHLIFPFGHHFLKCGRRPEIVGTEYNHWFDYDVSLTQYRGIRPSYRDPNYYFDKVSFNIDDELIPLRPYENYHFGKGEWDNQYKTDGTLKKRIQDIRDTKFHHFKEGKINQSDANYIAYKLLLEIPILAKNIAARFPIIIVDEAQDTTQIQMAILDRINQESLDSIMLIGDPDQAIFEWNTAEATYFIKKYESDHWHSIDLDENRRSSSNICSVLNRFFDNNMQSVSASKDCPLSVEIKEHDESKQSIQEIKESFLEECKNQNIAYKDVAIVFRGKRFGVQYFDLHMDSNELDFLPWKPNHYHVRDLIQGRYFIDSGELKDGYRLIERAYHKLKNPGLRYISRDFIRDQYQRSDYRTYRAEIFSLINLLPSTENQTLSNWVTEASASLGQNLEIKKGNGSRHVSELFQINTIQSLGDYKIDTVHSVKGSTVDAILVFLRKKSSTKEYKNIIISTYRETDSRKRKMDEEEIKIVYVACSRPRKLLWLAVCEGEHKSVWEQKLIN